MKFSTPFLATELKKELKSFGVNVLRCKQSNQNALVTIEGSFNNVELFLNFCKLNNYAGVSGLELRKPKMESNYVDFGNVIKYINVNE